MKLVVRPADAASLTSITARRYRVSGGFPASVTAMFTWKLLPGRIIRNMHRGDGGAGSLDLNLAAIGARFGIVEPFKAQSLSVRVAGRAGVEFQLRSGLGA